MHGTMLWHKLSLPQSFYKIKLHEFVYTVIINKNLFYKSNDIFNYKFEMHVEYSLSHLKAIDKKNILHFILAVNFLFC